MRPKLSYANVMATLGVFIALGGASYAAFKLPKNSVGTKQLKKNAVTKQKVSASERGHLRLQTMGAAGLEPATSPV